MCRHLQAEGDEIVPFVSADSARLDLLDRAAVRACVIESGAEAVYHLAALSNVDRSFQSPDKTIRVNVEGTVNLLDACREAGVARVLLVGSAAEYGDGSGSVDLLAEGSPLRPVSPYGASKVAAEYLGLQAHLCGELGVIMTRSFNHTGPGQSANFVVPALARRIATAERLNQIEIVVGRLDSVREFNDVRDVVRAYRLLVSLGVPGEVYNVCSGRAYSIQSVADRLLALARVPLRLQQDSALVRVVESKRLVGDPGKLKLRTGWEPRFDLDQTLADTLDCARDLSGVENSSGTKGFQ